MSESSGLGCVLVVHTVWTFRRGGEDHGPMFLIVVTPSPEIDRDWVARQLQIGNWVPCWRVHLRPAVPRSKITYDESSEPVREIRRIQPWLLDPSKCTTVRDWVGVAVVIGDDVELPALDDPPGDTEGFEVTTRRVERIHSATPPSYGEPIEDTTNVV